MILVTLQHPSPYYDDSYGVNSANNGPYGDAITKELIPAVETKFRALASRGRDSLTGGSTGGWISLAHQVLYPDFYGGTWSLCPDGVDFRYYQIVNIYADTNAYWLDHGWMRVERPEPAASRRQHRGDDEGRELVRARAGRPLALRRPVGHLGSDVRPGGRDGYPKRIWDKRTGVIDKSVAAYWRDHYDLRYILERDWATLGPKVADKINVYVGDADSYFLNMGVHMLDTFLASNDEPEVDGRDRLSTDGAALLGAESRRAVAEDGRAGGATRARRLDRGLEVLVAYFAVTRAFSCWRSRISPTTASPEARRKPRAHRDQRTTSAIRPSGERRDKQLSGERN